jgi:hypothetical protein
MALSMISSMSSLVTTPPLSTPGGTAFAATLPGAGPFGFFDPLNLVADKSSMEVMLYREAELAHGRVAMMAAVGYLVQEAFHPIFPVSAGVDGPVIRQLDQVLSTGAGQSAGFVMLLAVFFSEIYRAREGWEEPDDAYYSLREGYLPGDLKFDPLGVKPAGAEEFAQMQAKELNNGRLAMMAVAGMTAQELVTGGTLF